MTASLDQRSTGTRVATDKPRILVVEDDPIQRKVVSRLLLRWQFEPIEASDGGEAIDRLREAGAGFAAVVLDLMLPVIDGLGVAKVAVALAMPPPLIACSAAFNDRIEAELRSIGVRDFLPKPFAAEVLHAILLQVTEKAEDPAIVRPTD